LFWIKKAPLKRNLANIIPILSKGYVMDEELNDSFSEEEIDDISTRSLELASIIQSFTDDYFNDEYEVLRFNINFLESNGFTYQTKIDYMKLNRFVSAAFNTIQSNDMQAIDVLVSKFYKDIIFLNNFYKIFLDKSCDVYAVFKHQFLKEYGSIEQFYLFFHAEEGKKKTQEKKPPTKEEITLFEEYIREEFRIFFLKEVQSYGDELRTIINTKMYYFDKLLWSEAKKSLSIREFFKKSKRSEGDISDELSTKVFIKQYMRTIDLAHTKDARWHQYLENVLKIMD